MVARHFPVEGGHVLMFARAIGDTDPQYSEAPDAVTGAAPVAVPPTFVQSSAQFDPDYPLRPADDRPWFGSGATPSGLSQPAADSSGESSGGKGSALHAEQRFDYVRPLRTGDVLTAAELPGRSWEKVSRKGGKLVFTESVTEYRDAAGELVVTATAVAVQTESTPTTSDTNEERS